MSGTEDIGIKVLHSSTRRKRSENKIGKNGGAGPEKENWMGTKRPTARKDDCHQNEGKEPNIAQKEMQFPVAGDTEKLVGYESCWRRSSLAEKRRVRAGKPAAERKGIHRRSWCRVEKNQKVG